MSLSIDPAFSKASPLYVNKGLEDCRCERCSHVATEITEVEYVMYGQGENEPSEFMNLCEDCLWAIRKDERYVLI